MLSIHDKPFFSKNEDKVKIIFAVLECWQEIAAVYSDNIVNESSEEEKTAIKCHWGRLIKDLFQGLLDKEPHMQRVQPCQIKNIKLHKHSFFSFAKRFCFYPDKFI